MFNIICYINCSLSFVGVLSEFFRNVVEFSSDSIFKI